MACYSCYCCWFNSCCCRFSLTIGQQLMMRLQHYITKQLWCIVFIAFTGVGLIYVLSTTGVLDAMRDDNTLSSLYDEPAVVAPGKFPLAPRPYQQAAAAGSGMTTAAGDDAYVAVNEAQELRLQQLNHMASLVHQDVKHKFAASRTAASASVTSARNRSSSLIPRIIHQTWDSQRVPRSFVKGMRSFVDLHPRWEYWFWTPRAVECFLRRHFPRFLALFDSYPDPTSKADALRYFFLYTYGGVYADLDTVCLKPLDMWVNSYCCLLSEEPYEHSYIVREANVSNIVNSPMACRARHPLFRAAIDGLHASAAIFLGDYLQSTGPVYLERVYENFVLNHTYRAGASSSASGGDDGASGGDGGGASQCAITLTPPKYFLPRFDPNQSGIIDARCNQRTYRQLSPKQQRVCERLIKNSYRNDVDADSYMDHSWIHVNMMGEQFKLGNTLPLKEIVPTAKDMELQFCS